MRIEGILAAAFVVALGGLGMASAQAPEQTDRVYEMRTYWSPEGKLDELHARFRDHTMKLFEKHGMTNVAYWVPIDNTENKLVYILSYPSKDAATKAWKDFLADPDWQAAYKASEANGTLVKKHESKFLTTTDYSPKLPTAIPGDHVFELRIYDTTAGHLPNLDARFRDHTIKLFEKHGMTNLVYWHMLPGQKGADDTLVYMLAHKSVEAAKASFDAFRTDPDWVAARKASEEKAGGSLTVENGVHSTFLKATDYSPLK
jgi:NIPSNAP